MRWPSASSARAQVVSSAASSASASVVTPGRPVAAAVLAVRTERGGEELGRQLVVLLVREVRQRRHGRRAHRPRRTPRAGPPHARNRPPRGRRAAAERAGGCRSGPRRLARRRFRPNRPCASLHSWTGQPPGGHYERRTGLHLAAPQASIRVSSTPERARIHGRPAAPTSGVGRGPGFGLILDRHVMEPRRHAKGVPGMRITPPISPP